MFPIQIRINRYKETSEQIIRDSAKEMAVPDKAISSVIVASEIGNDYAASIRQCRGHDGSKTHSSGGAGKTVPFRNEEGIVQSDVIYPSSTLTTLFECSKEFPLYLLSRYAVHHELGHVIDFNSRSVLFPSPLLGNERTIKDYSQYYGAILLSEFAATFLAGECVTIGQYHAIASNARDSIESLVGNSTRIQSPAIWELLVQETQVAGTAMGIKGNPIPTLVRWYGVSEASMRELEQFSVELRELKGKYPIWDNISCIAQLTERCRTFAATLRG